MPISGVKAWRSSAVAALQSIREARDESFPSAWNQVRNDSPPRDWEGLEWYRSNSNLADALFAARDMSLDLGLDRGDALQMRRAYLKARNADSAVIYEFEAARTARAHNNVQQRELKRIEQTDALLAPVQADVMRRVVNGDVPAIRKPTEREIKAALASIDQSAEGLRTVRAAVAALTLDDASSLTRVEKLVPGESIRAWEKLSNARDIVRALSAHERYSGLPTLTDAVGDLANWSVASSELHYQQLFDEHEPEYLKNVKWGHTQAIDRALRQAQRASDYLRGQLG